MYIHRGTSCRFPHFYRIRNAEREEKPLVKFQIRSTAHRNRNFLSVSKRKSNSHICWSAQKSIHHAFMEFFLKNINSRASWRLESCDSENLTVGVFHTSNTQDIFKRFSNSFKIKIWHLPESLLQEEGKKKPHSGFKQESKDLDALATSAPKFLICWVKIAFCDSGSNVN